MKLYVNKERTILPTIWPSGEVTIAFREHGWDTWGPPITLVETT